ncbi:FixH family protein [Dyadobacter linearis]|nr:FixH family protein [Dyadobacter sp. CECT 9623]
MKKLKMNWGTGIAAVYLGFVIMILVLVGMSASQKIDLATDKYYDAELKFQEKIDKTKRALLLPQPLSWELTGDQIRIHFPEGFKDHSISGKLNLYCPSNNQNDRTFKLEPVHNEQLISLKDTPAGRYILQFDWQAGPETYWNEGVLTLEQTKNQPQK